MPVNGPNGDHPGMSLRDYFAVHAPADWLKRKFEYLRQIDRSRVRHDASGQSIEKDEEALIAMAQFIYADAMLAERTEGGA